MNLSKQQKSLHFRGASSLKNVFCLAVTINLISKESKAQSVPAFLTGASSIVCTVPPLSAVGQQLPLFGATEKQTVGLSYLTMWGRAVLIQRGFTSCKGHVQLLHTSLNSIDKKHCNRKFLPTPYWKRAGEIYSGNCEVITPVTTTDRSALPLAQSFCLPLHRPTG